MEWKKKKNNSINRSFSKSIIEKYTHKYPYFQAKHGCVVAKMAMDSPLINARLRPIAFDCRAGVAFR
jgi:hypothetical protein